MTPQQPPPKPFAVARTEVSYDYYDTLQEAFEEWTDLVSTQEVGPELGTIIELWVHSEGVWNVSNSKEFAGLPWPVD